MIVFDLRCGGGHVFEAWFGSSAAYDDQRTRGLVACPICGDGDVTKAVMAPNIAAKGNTRSDIPAPVGAGDAPPPEAVKAVMAKIAEIQSQMLEKSTWVGKGFADQARAMHLGETEHAPIHGQTTADEAKALIDEGVPVAPLLVPIVPPEACN